MNLAALTPQWVIDAWRYVIYTQPMTAADIAAITKECAMPGQFWARHHEVVPRNFWMRTYKRVPGGVWDVLRLQDGFLIVPLGGEYGVLTIQVAYGHKSATINKIGDDIYYADVTTARGPANIPAEYANAIRSLVASIPPLDPNAHPLH